MSVQVEGYRNESFEALEAAVMETPRGRWFLEEYAKRQRAKETLALLETMRRIEKLVSTSPALPVPQPALNDQSLKFFKKDEDLFEPPPPTYDLDNKTSKVLPESKGAKLHIHHAGDAPSSLESEPEAATIEVLHSATPEAPALTDLAVTPESTLHMLEEQQFTGFAENPKPRVVIIRKSATELQDIPLPEEDAHEAVA